MFPEASNGRLQPWDPTDCIKKAPDNERRPHADFTDGDGGLETCVDIGVLDTTPSSPSLMKKAQSDVDVAGGDLELMALLGQAPSSLAPFPSNRRKTLPTLPPLFKQEIESLFSQGRISAAVARYYLDTLPRGDSTRIPGYSGRASLLEAVLTEDVHKLRKQDAPGSGWRPIRIIGKGAFGCVILWEKPQKQGAPLRIASKDTACSSFFKDYCAEGHLTRRLNDTGCKNVINVAEWKYIDLPVYTTSDGTVYRTPPKNRICYEYAEYSDLRRLQSWYRKQRLIIPEAFIWHLLFSIANALMFCRHGTNMGPAKVGWDPIVHGDVKQANIFLTRSNDDNSTLYPTVKLADFGLAYTFGGGTAAVQHYRSLAVYGTDGYMAPEIEDQTPEQVGRRRLPHELHGPHSDIYSLGVTCKHLVSLVDIHLPRSAHGDATETASDQPAGPTLSDFYSMELQSLLDRCTSRNPRERPKTSKLFHETKVQMMRHHKMMQIEAIAARRECCSRFFHSQVLYTPEDQVQFETDPMFRNSYEKANLTEVWTLAETRRSKDTGKPILPPSPSYGGEKAKPSQLERVVRAILRK